MVFLHLSAGRCKLDLQLLSQEMHELQRRDLYPINSLRNRALAAAETDVSGCAAGVA